MVSDSEAAATRFGFRPAGQPLLLGHRGARLELPENTLAAFDLALAQGCDGFEFDVRLTRDGFPVLCHDPRLKRKSIRRTTYRKLCERLTRKMTDAPDDADILPGLHDVLDRFGSRAWLDIELKVRGVEQQTLDAIRQHGLKRNFCVSSFRLKVLKELRARDAEIPLGFLTDKRWRIGKWDRYDIQVVIPHHTLVSRSLVEEVHAAGKMLMTWTVNRPKKMRAFAEMGVDAIISDDTRLLVETLRKAGDSGSGVA